MKKQATFSWLYIPLSILIFLAFALFVERSGIPYTVTEKPTEFLPPITNSGKSVENEPIAVNQKSLVLTYTDSIVDEKSSETVAAVLNSMKVNYEIEEVSSELALHLAGFDTVIITFVELDQINNQLDTLMEWVHDGGKLLFSIRPDNHLPLRSISENLGIADIDNGFNRSSGIIFRSELLPGTSGIIFGEAFMHHTSLPVKLTDDAYVHILSADDDRIPILWEKNVGRGRIVMVNSDQFIDKSSRGLIGAAYSLLHDVVIYPVINAATFHIDDFPAPVPEGKDEKIFSQFTRDIKSFYLNVWLTDLQDLKEKYNLVFSSFIIETYDDIIEPPFFYNLNQEEVFQYFGGIVLRDGGEIGLHGYNHIPFCMKADNKNQVLDYPSWQSEADMQAAAKELESFSSSMLDGQPFSVYVPPSNMLCDDAREWLPDIWNDLRVIASVYLPDANVPAYVQEFGEAEDGIIEYPRITSGYQPDNFMYWAQANEIWLHYASGHFIHPDDVLDSYRSKGKTWVDMRETMDEYLLWLYSSMPEVRNLTASEGGMAVQRYARANPFYECSDTDCQIDLKGFYDQAWFLMRTKKKPASITNGAFLMVSTDLYLIEANADNLKIGFED